MTQEFYSSNLADILAHIQKIIRLIFLRYQSAPEEVLILRGAFVKICQNYWELPMNEVTRPKSLPENSRAISSSEDQLSITAFIELFPQALRQEVREKLPLELEKNNGFQDALEGCFLENSVTEKNLNLFLFSWIVHANKLERKLAYAVYLILDHALTNMVEICTLLTGFRPATVVGIFSYDNILTDGKTEGRRPDQLVGNSVFESVFKELPIWSARFVQADLANFESMFFPPTIPLGVNAKRELVIGGFETITGLLSIFDALNSAICKTLDIPLSRNLYEILERGGQADTAMTTLARQTEREASEAIASLKQTTLPQLITSASDQTRKALVILRALANHFSASHETTSSLILALQKTVTAGILPRSRSMEFSTQKPPTCPKDFEALKTDCESLIGLVTLFYAKNSQAELILQGVLDQLNLLWEKPSESREKRLPNQNRSSTEILLERVNLEGFFLLLKREPLLAEEAREKLPPSIYRNNLFQNALQGCFSPSIICRENLIFFLLACIVKDTHLDTNRACATYLILVDILRNPIEMLTLNLSFTPVHSLSVWLYHEILTPTITDRPDQLVGGGFFEFILNTLIPNEAARIRHQPTAALSAAGLFFRRAAWHEEGNADLPSRNIPLELNEAAERELALSLFDLAATIVGQVKNLHHHVTALNIASSSDGKISQDDPDLREITRRSLKMFLEERALRSPPPLTSNVAPNQTPSDSTDSRSNHMQMFFTLYPLFVNNQARFVEMLDIFVARTRARRTAGGPGTPMRRTLLSSVSSFLRPSRSTERLSESFSASPSSRSPKQLADRLCSLSDIMTPPQRPRAQVTFGIPSPGGSASAAASAYRAEAASPRTPSTLLREKLRVQFSSRAESLKDDPLDSIKIAHSIKECLASICPDEQEYRQARQASVRT